MKFMYEIHVTFMVNYLFNETYINVGTPPRHYWLMLIRFTHQPQWFVDSFILPMNWS